MNIQSIVNNIYGHDVPRQYGMMSASFAVCLLTSVANTCYESRDPDCLQFSGIKNFTNSYSNQLKSYPWSKVQPLADELLPRSNKVGFLVSFFASIYQYFNEQEKQKMGTTITRDVIRWMHEICSLSNVSFKLAKECIIKSYQDYQPSLVNLPTSTSSIPLPSAPPPPPVPKCEGYFPDFEICGNLDMTSTLTKCTQEERVCIYRPYKAYHECSCS